MTKLKRILALAACICITAATATNVSAKGAIVVEQPVQTVNGDANGDGKFAVSDLIILNQWLSGTAQTDLNSYAADINRDGFVNVFDANIMRKRLLDMGYDLTALNLSEDFSSAEVTGAAADEEFVLGQTEFALSLLKNGLQENTNTLISPYSAMQALAMTANGANGETKAQMEKVLGGMSIERLNEYLYTQRTSQLVSEKSKLSTANSIWTDDDEERIQVLPEFLQRNADYYSADVFKADFSNESTVKDVNYWVKDKTDHMIPHLLDEIPSTAPMMLINAVAFDSKWEVPYDEDSVDKDREFKAYDGSVQSADMMVSDNDLLLKDENAVGVYKYYEGRRYAFAALLPDEGISVDEYVAGLTPESLHNTLANPIHTNLVAEIPKFSYDFNSDLSQTLIKMGMPAAFDMFGADFSNMAKTETGALYIDKVVQKTHIDVFEEGTRAAAVTAVIMNDCTAVPTPPEFVTLDRPFVYCIVDTETDLPIFIGTLENIPE